MVVVGDFLLLLVNIEVVVVEKIKVLRSLLVFDDEKDVVVMICMMVVMVFYDIDYVDNVDIFLEKVVIWVLIYVVVDLKLVDCDGIEVICKLVEMECNVVVIIMLGLGGCILEFFVRVVGENGF